MKSLGIQYDNGHFKAAVIDTETGNKGIGTAVFNNGVLIPNTELGNLYYKDKIIEQYASDSIRKQENLSWKKWGKRLFRYLKYLERIFNPDLIIISGNVSKKFSKYEKYLNKLDSPTIPAYFNNNASIIGAAIASIQQTKE